MCGQVGGWPRIARGLLGRVQSVMAKAWVSVFGFGSGELVLLLGTHSSRFEPLPIPLRGPVLLDIDQGCHNSPASAKRILQHVFVLHSRK